jgi:hypothetical protein
MLGDTFGEDGMGHVVGDMVAAIIATENELTERMLERMLVTPGAGGVRVYAWWEGMEFRIRAELSHEVPFGTVERCEFAPPA